jgi:hypothetical protein
VSQDASRIGKLILVPAVITLAVTLLRLVGECRAGLLCSPGSAYSAARSSGSGVAGLGVWRLVRMEADPRRVGAKEPRPRLRADVGCAGCATSHRIPRTQSRHRAGAHVETQRAAH